MLVEISICLISPDAPCISLVNSSNTVGIREILRKMGQIVLFPAFTPFPHMAPRGIIFIIKICNYSNDVQEFLPGNKVGSLSSLDCI